MRISPVLGPDLAERTLQEELMDDPGLASSEHHQALRALALVNRLSLTASRVWNELLRLAGKVHDRPLRLLDVACGGGDTVRALKRRALQKGISLNVQGCDVSPVAVAHARQEAARMGVEASFFELDVLRDPIPGEFDLVCSTLFLHHLEEEDVVRLLARMAEAGRTLVLQDLQRNRIGYWLAFGTLRLLSRSRVAQVDGPRSVQAAFRIPEMAALARRAGLEGARIVPCWPQRFSLFWSRG